MGARGHLDPARKSRLVETALLLSRFLPKTDRPLNTTSGTEKVTDQIRDIFSELRPSITAPELQTLGMRVPKSIAERDIVLTLQFQGTHPSEDVSLPAIEALDNLTLSTEGSVASSAHKALKHIQIFAYATAARERAASSLREINNVRQILASRTREASEQRTVAYSSN